MNITTLLKKTNRLLIKKANELLKPHGITHAYTFFLMELYTSDAQKQSDLYKAIGIEQPTAVRTLDRMQRDGLITRNPCPNDRRVIQICLTEKGALYKKTILDCANELNKIALEGLSDRDKNNLRNYVSIMNLNLN